MRQLLAVVVFAGCFAPSVPTGALCTTTEQCPAGQSCIDGRCGGGGVVDAANVDPPDAPPVTGCWNAWLSGTIALSAPKPIEELATDLQTLNPTLSDDLRTIYFSRTNGTDLDLWFATRASPSQSFDAPAKVEGLQSTADDSKVSVVAGDLVAVFSSTRAGGVGAVDLWQAERTVSSDKFDGASTAPFASINDAASQFDPEVTPDGLHLFYAPNGPGIDTQRIKHASRSSTSAAFGPPLEVSIPGTPTSFDPTVSPDRRVMVYTSTPGDLFYVTRDDPDGSFGAPRAIPNVNSLMFDGDAELASDGCSIVFVSARNGPRALFAANVVSVGP